MPDSNAADDRQEPRRAYASSEKAEDAIVAALQQGGIDAADIPAHSALGQYSTDEIERSVVTGPGASLVRSGERCKVTPRIVSCRLSWKTKGHFPNEEAARKLIYLAITNAVPAWTRTRNWTTALLAFKIHFGDRLPA